MYKNEKEKGKSRVLGWAFVSFYKNEILVEGKGERPSPSSPLKRCVEEENMFRLTTALFHPPIPFSIRSDPPTTPILSFKATANSIYPYFHVPRKLVVKAEKGNGKEGEEEKRSKNGGGEDLKKDKGPILNVKWRDLLDPNPENILAIGLSGVLTWASVQVLWQLFFISLTILVAALKYSFIAALLIFILITLL